MFCTNLLSRWRQWIKTVVMCLYTIFVLLLLPKLIITSIYKRKEKNDQTAFVGGIFVMMAIPISLWEIVQHMVHYSRPSLQLHIIRLVSNGNFCSLTSVASCLFFKRMYSFSSPQLNHIVNAWIYEIMRHIKIIDIPNILFKLLAQYTLAFAALTIKHVSSVAGSLTLSLNISVPCSAFAERKKIYRLP